MPAYSFKERFVPMVEDGSKPCTIRSFRRYPVRVGQEAHLFYGMRTAHCRRLRPAVGIKAVYCIYMDKNEVVLFDKNWLEELDREKLLQVGTKCLRGTKGNILLSGKQRDELAWRDGFRYEPYPDAMWGCGYMMYKYWVDNGCLPFVGFITVWGDDFIKNWMR